LIISGIVSVLLAYLIPSVIEIWYTIGSICIPGIILPVVSSYYIKLKIDNKLVLLEMIISVMAGLIWFFVRQTFKEVFLLRDLEPMLVGLSLSVLIHTYGLLRSKFFSFVE
jgi:SSS family solute:Na+ symporter